MPSTVVSRRRVWRRAGQASDSVVDAFDCKHNAQRARSHSADRATVASSAIVRDMEVAMTVRGQLFRGVLFLCVCGIAVTQTLAQVTRSVPPKDIRVTLLGTGSGPRAYVDKAGISTLVEAGGERLLFDAGRGFMQRLVQAGFPMNAVTKLFLTHLHSDHVIGVPDLMLSPWAAAPERKVPLEVWGPDGTRDMMHHLTEAFAFDIHMRRDVDESFSP